MKMIYYKTGISLLLLFTQSILMIGQPGAEGCRTEPFIKVGLEENVKVHNCEKAEKANRMNDLNVFDHCIPISCGIKNYSERSKVENESAEFVFVKNNEDTMFLSIINIKQNIELQYFIEKIPFIPGSFKLLLADPITKNDGSLSYEGIYLKNKRSQNK